MLPSFKIIGLLVLKKKSFKVLTIYRRGCHFGNVTIYTNLSFPLILYMEFGFDDDDDDGRRRRTNGFTPEDAYTLSSRCEPNGSGGENQLLYRAG